VANNLPSIPYSIVVPVLNVAVIRPILSRRIGMLMGLLDGPAETIFVEAIE
jgi:hypothetical protein